MPIKFNGMLFTSQLPPETSENGPLFRFWGAHIWWQNTRLPYGPMLAAGDFDTFVVVLEAYLATVALTQARRLSPFTHHFKCPKALIRAVGSPFQTSRPHCPCARHAQASTTATAASSGPRLPPTLGHSHQSTTACPVVSATAPRCPSGSRRIDLYDSIPECAAISCSAFAFQPHLHVCVGA